MRGRTDQLTAKGTLKLWCAGLLALGSLVSCGGSTSRDGDARPSTSTGGTSSGGTANDRPAAGGNASGGAGAANGGDTAPSTGGSPEGGNVDESGGETSAAGAAPALPLLPGCQARSPTETSEFCRLTVDCDSAPSTPTYCHRLDSKHWECQCAYQDIMYRLEDAAGIQACALAAGLCSDEHPKLGAEICEQANPQSAQNSCSVDVTCTAPVELRVPSDAHAWRERFDSTRCDREQSDEAFRCSCTVGTQTQQYRLVAASGELACAPLADFCMKGEAPVYSNPEVCTSTSSNVDGGRCWGGAECGPHLALTDQVNLADLATRTASCDPNAKGGSDCVCGDESSAFQFHVSGAPSTASCETALLNCNPQAVIKTTGPATCTPPPTDDWGDWCEANLICNQDATVDNRSLVALAYLDVLCLRDGEGLPWRCSCASGPKVSQVPLGAPGASGPQACSQASAVCLESPGLLIGTYRDPLPGPPDPVAKVLAR
jgi:hypothetical protein